MSPTFVIPPTTGTAGADEPASVTPATTPMAFTIIGPRIVGRPEIENVPSAAVEAETPKAVTVAPATGVPALLVTTRPLAVVSGSGMTGTTTFSAMPVRLP